MIVGVQVALSSCDEMGPPLEDVSIFFSSEEQLKTFMREASRARPLYSNWLDGESSVIPERGSPASNLMLMHLTAREAQDAIVEAGPAKSLFIIKPFWIMVITLGSWAIIAIIVVLVTRKGQAGAARTPAHVASIALGHSDKLHMIHGQPLTYAAYINQSY